MHGFSALTTGITESPVVMNKPLARRSFLRSRGNDADATARVAQVGGNFTGDGAVWR